MDSPPQGENTKQQVNSSSVDVLESHLRVMNLLYERLKTANGLVNDINSITNLITSEEKQAMIAECDGLWKGTVEHFKSRHTSYVKEYLRLYNKSLDYDYTNRQHLSVLSAIAKNIVMATVPDIDGDSEYCVVFTSMDMDRHISMTYNTHNVSVAIDIQHPWEANITEFILSSRFDDECIRFREGLEIAAKSPTVEDFVNSHYPPQTMKRRRHHSDNFCVICQSDFDIGDIVVERRNCKHRFHEECAKNNFIYGKSAQCPVCKN